MATVQANRLSRYLCKVVLRQDGGMTDGQLLECFRSQRDEAAFAALMRRHGPMVFGVCGRVLRTAHDAEDAFQATFLVLVRKARSVGRPELLGNWLYGVAYRTAMAARRATAKRRAKEREMAKPEAVEDDGGHELASLLDRELVQLPEKYRVPIVLCDLEGKTRKEAARQLGWPEGTINGRLARGRVLLAKRLARSGSTLSGGAIAAVLAQQAASDGMPVGLAASTLKAATVVAAGTAAGTGLISAQVVALTEGIVKAMFLTKLKIAGTLLTAVVAVGLTTAFGPLSPQGDKPAQNRPELASLEEQRQTAKDKIPKADNPTANKADVSKQNLPMNLPQTAKPAQKQPEPALLEERRQTPKDKEPKANDPEPSKADVSKQNLPMNLPQTAKPAQNGPEPASPKKQRQTPKDKPVVVREDAILQRMALSSDGEIVATVGVTHDGSTYNSTVKLWDARTGKLKRALAEEKDSHLEIAFSRDLLAIGVNGKLKDTDPRGPREVRLLDAKTGELKHKIDETLVPGVFSWSALAFSPDGKRLAVAGIDDAPFVKLWDVEKKKLIEGKVAFEGVPHHANAVCCLAFSPDGKVLAAGCDDAKIRLFDAQTGEFTTLLDTEMKRESRYGVGGIAFSPDSKTLASKGGDNTVVLWDLTEGKPRRTLKGHKGQVDAVAFSRDGRLIATGGRTAKENVYEVILWDAKTGEVKQTFPDLTEWVHVVAFSPDGKTLAVCGGHGAGEGQDIKTSGAITLFRLE